MTDFDNNPLAVGDLVAYLPPHYRHMIKGIVVAFTPKMVRIQRILGEKEAERYRQFGWAAPTDVRESGYIVKIGKYNA